MMKIVLGSDHAGFALKQHLLEPLRAQGHDVFDAGVHSDAPSDYPDAARAVGEAVTAGRVQRGILICGSGVGASVAASKLRGIRAAVCHDTYSARQGVEHDDLNVLVLGARVIGTALACELVQAFLAATFTGEERHRRRLSKVKAIEDREGEKR